MQVIENVSERATGFPFVAVASNECAVHLMAIFDHFSDVHVHFEDVASMASAGCNLDLLIKNLTADDACRENTAEATEDAGAGSIRGTGYFVAASEKCKVWIDAGIDLADIIPD